MQSIMTNEIIPVFDYDSLNEKYDIYCLRFQIRDKKFDFRRTKLLDEPLISKDVLAVEYKPFRAGDPACVYVLMKKSDGNRYILRDLIENDPDYDNITIIPVRAEKIDACDLLQLCFNAITNDPNSAFPSGNLTGGLYIFSPKHIDRDRKSGDIKQIHSLMIKISRRLCLYMNVVTFTNSRKIPHEEGKALYKYTSYPVFSMQRVYAPMENDITFVVQQYDGGKYNIPFLSLIDKEAFESSKIGVLNSVLNSFNRMFGELIQITFRDISEYKTIERTSREKRENDRRVKDFISNRTIVLINHTGAKGEDSVLKDIGECLNFYGAKTVISENPIPDYLNVVLVHNAKYYSSNKIKDPYKFSASNDSLVVQHVTVEDLGNVKLGTTKKGNITVPATVRNIIYQFIIKDDLNKKHFTLYDWDHTADDMEFVYKYGKNNEKTAIMCVKPDGSFDIHRSVVSLNRSDMIDVIQRNEDINPELCISDNKGNEYVIIGTKWHTIPNYKGIAFQLEANNTKLKNREMRTELLMSNLDIKSFVLSDNEYAYFVGAIGNGLDDSGLSRAPNIRIVKASDNASYEYFTKYILPLMNVSFVRNNQLTVLPFPFKYLREWAKQGEIKDELNF